jgi:hypothetical protein
LPFFVFSCPVGAGEDAGDVAAVSSGADDRDTAQAVHLHRDIYCGQWEHRSKYREKYSRLPYIRPSGIFIESPDAKLKYEVR